MKMDGRNYTVYKHTMPDGKVYIGITSQPCRDRWRNGHGYKENAAFYREIIKTGWDNIRHEILFRDLSEEDAKAKEKELILAYGSEDTKNGYNQTNFKQSLLDVKGIEYNQRNKKNINKHTPEILELTLDEYYLYTVMSMKAAVMRSIGKTEFQIINPNEKIIKLMFELGSKRAVHFDFDTVNEKIVNFTVRCIGRLLNNQNIMLK